MQILELDGVDILGVGACLPVRSVDNLADCRRLCASAEKAAAIVQTTGIRTRRVAEPGVTSLDLCVCAAEALLKRTATPRAEIGAVLQVTFTPVQLMPCNACQAQARLGLGKDIVAFDVNLACSGWTYGLYVAGMLAKATGRKVLLLDGDVQTPYLRPDDAASVPLLADAGTATLVAPGVRALGRFAFQSDGTRGAALSLPIGGTFAMDGFGVFRYVTTDVLRFLQDFLAQTGATSAALDAFVPHQANVFMIRQIAKKLGFGPDKLKISGDVFGNPASASVPVTLAHCRPHGTVLVAGFGGGLSAAAGVIRVGGDCAFVETTWRGGEAARG